MCPLTDWLYLLIYYNLLILYEKENENVKKYRDTYCIVHTYIYYHFISCTLRKRWVYRCRVFYVIHKSNAAQSLFHLHGAGLLARGHWDFPQFLCSVGNSRCFLLLYHQYRPVRVFEDSKSHYRSPLPPEPRQFRRVSPHSISIHFSERSVGSSGLIVSNN